MIARLSKMILRLRWYFLNREADRLLRRARS